MNYRVNAVFSLALFACVISCKPSKGTEELVNEADDVVEKTAYFEKERKVSTISNRVVQEASGLECSVRNAGGLWTVNDSGNEPVLYLIDTLGEVRQQITLGELKNRDWEELCLANGYLYVADFGDNKAVREEVYIHRFKEPKAHLESHWTLSQDSIQTMTIIYENGARDAEALMFDYESKELVLLTKREPQCFIYSFTFEEGVHTISPKGTIDATLLNAADSRSDGAFIIKNYDFIYFWPADTGSIVSRMLNEPWWAVSYEPEPQGESISFDDRGGFYTLSEYNEGYDQELIYHAASE